MARYHFHLHECGNVTPDYQGRDLSDPVAVRACAIAVAREIMSAEVAQGRLCLACCVEVVGADGQPVMSVPFREAIIVTGLSAGF